MRAIKTILFRLFSLDNQPAKTTVAPPKVNGMKGLCKKLFVFQYNSPFVTVLVASDYVNRGVKKPAAPWGSQSDSTGRSVMRHFPRIQPDCIGHDRTRLKKWLVWRKSFTKMPSLGGWTKYHMRCFVFYPFSMRFAWRMQPKQQYLFKM